MLSDPHLAPCAANHAPLTPLDLYDRTVALMPDRVAVIWGDLRLTWGRFDALVQRMANTLRERGIGKGDVVSIIAANRPEMLAAHFAVPMLGAVLNAINMRLDAETVRYILGHSRSRLMLCDPAHAGLATEGAGALPVLCFSPDPPPGTEAFDLLDRTNRPAAPIDWRANVADEWQPIALNYTSGTTGAPKGVVLHHRGAYQNALGNVLALGFGRDTVYLWTLPLFHCNGWCHGWAVTAAGGIHVCLDGVHPDAIFAAIREARVTHLACAPVVLYMLLNDPARAARTADAPRLLVATGGAAPTPSLIEQMEEIGFDLTHLYGLTECYGPVSMNELTDDRRGATAAENAALLTPQGMRHATGSLLRVVDATGAEVPRDGQTMGEIVLRGNTVMAGYLGDAEATAAAFADGWFHTGDLAVVNPDGYAEIRDRAKDIINTGGEKVSSLEVERVLHRHPDVLLAAVVAAPHPKWGETPYAFVEVKAGACLAEEALIGFARDHLAHFKAPRQVIFAAIPKTATGKVQKFVLRQQAAALAAEAE
ncbi:MAG: AMP-binding protein [Rhodovulum sp.]